MSEKLTPEPAKLEEPAPVSGDKLPRSTVVVLSILLFTAFVMLLNETTLAIALPAMMSDYNITAATAQWLLTGFMLTLAVVMPTTGWMLDRFTTRSTFIFAISDRYGHRSPSTLIWYLAGRPRLPGHRHRNRYAIADDRCDDADSIPSPRYDHGPDLRGHGRWSGTWP
mgnify:CR=1 FL=1